MVKNGMFDSSIRSFGDKAGVFEYDGEAGYFYLYDMENEKNQKIINAIQILSIAPDFESKDVIIRWDSTERIVALFICGQLWAAFDSQTGTKYGGNYDKTTCPEIPMEISTLFRI